jgi:hypothetical protein
MMSKLSAAAGGNGSGRRRRQLQWLIAAVVAGAAFGRGTPGRAQTALSRVGTNLMLSFPTASNQIYYIQRRDSLATGSWSTIASNIVGTGQIWTNTDTGAATLLSRYYRVGSAASGTGTVFVAVTLANGTNAVDSWIQFIYSGGKTNNPGLTDSNGHLTYTKVPVGSFTVRAEHPFNPNAYADVPSSLPSNGAVVSVSVTLPCVVDVDYQVFDATTNGVAGAQTFLVSGPTQYGPGYTASDGSGTFVSIPPGAFTLTASGQNSSATVNGTVPSNCAPVSVTIYLPTN